MWAAYLAVLVLGDPARHLVAVLVVLSVAFVLLWLVAGRLEAVSGSPGRAILLGAVLFRSTLLPVAPTLSDDVQRYLWDGKVAAAGENPYALAPDAAELQGLRDDRWRLLPHKSVPTVYPPLAVAGFSIATHFPAPLAAWKGLAVGADLGLCALLLALCRRLGLPEARAAWYAWNPLVVLEVAGMGHVDALGAGCAVAAVLFLSGGGRKRPAVAATWAAGGALAKLVPLAAFPMWARQSGRSRLFVAVALGLTATALLPVFAASGGVPPGLVTYGVSWEHNGPFFEPLWRAFDRARVAPAIKGGLDDLKRATGLYQALNPLYPWVYPQLLAKAALGLAALAACAASLAERDPVAGTGRLFGRLFLASATVYPWYLLWVLPWAAVTRRASWLALSALVLLSYLPLSAEVALWPGIWAAVWLPFFGLALWRREL